jgi:serine/threonine protein kinase
MMCTRVVNSSKCFANIMSWSKGLSQIVAHGEYCLLGRLPSTSYGEIFLAKSTRSADGGALLTYLRVEHESGSGAARAKFFIDTSRALLHCSHAHITEVIDCGDADDELFVVKKFLHGKGLDELLDSIEQSGKPLRAESLSKIGLSVADGLGFVHSKHRCHGALTLENVAIGYDGEVKISNFGIGSDHLSANSDMSTDEWDESVIRLSPEQVDGQAATPRSDVFLAGMIFFELLTGRAPFQNKNRQGSLKLLSEAKLVFPEKSTLPASIAEVVVACLAKDPSERFADGYALLEALKATVWGDDFSENTNDLKDLMMLSFSEDYTRERPHIEQYRQLDVKGADDSEENTSAQETAQSQTTIQDISLIRSRMGHDLNPSNKSAELTDEFEIDTDGFEEEIESAESLRVEQYAEKTEEVDSASIIRTDQTDITPLKPESTQPKKHTLNDLAKGVGQAPSVGLDTNVGDFTKQEQAHQPGQKHNAPIGRESFIVPRASPPRPKTSRIRKASVLTGSEKTVLWAVLAMGLSVIYYTYAHIHTTEALHEIVSQLLAWSSEGSSS